jgi:ankyrin repeat protein
VAALLLDHGAKVDPRDPAGRTALMYASSGPFVETVELLLEHGADPLAVDQEEHFTPLMFAASEGQAEVVRVLLEHGSDPSMMDVDGDTALSFATQHGHAEVVDLLNEQQRSR